MKYFYLFMFWIGALSAAAQNFDPKLIDIVRDRWGVPHIFSKTDAGVAYGLAWAHAEDDFKTIQQGFLAGKAMLGLYSGKQGATIDYVIQFLQCRKIVDERYELDISPAYKTILESYTAGINAYAKAHPNEVLVKKCFPVTPKDMLTYSPVFLAGSPKKSGNLEQFEQGSLLFIGQEEAGFFCFGIRQCDSNLINGFEYVNRFFRA